MLREEKDMTMRDMVKKFGKSQSTFSSYENNSRKPDIEFLKKLAEFFGVTVDYLIGNSNLRYEPNTVITDALRQNPKLFNFWIEISRREDLQILFEAAECLSPKAIKAVAEFITTIEQNQGNRGGK